MLTNRTVRLVLIFAAIVLSVWYLYPTIRFYSLSEAERSQLSSEDLHRLRDRAIKLGLDLQGGMHLVLEVDTAKLPPDEVKDAAARAKEIITNRIDQFGVAEPIVQSQGDQRIIVELPGIKDIERATRLIGQTAQLEFRLLRPLEEFENILKAIDAKVSPRAKVDTTGQQAKREGGLFEEREEEEEEAGPSFFSLLEGDRVPVRNTDRVRAILADPSIAGVIPDDTEILWGEKEGEGRLGHYPLYYVKKKPEMTGEVIEDARAQLGSGMQMGEPIVTFSTTDDGMKLFARVTGANVGQRMAIVLDRVVKSAPTIRDKIPNGEGIIEGRFTIEEVRDLAIVLRAGALPAPINIISKQVVGPSLGSDSIRMGTQAAIIGLILVAIFMIIYYHLSGVIANIALVLNMMMLLAMMAGYGATLTLPGIAGIILTMGMAVDANVLIYERIREELLAGKTVRTAIDTGYRRAFTTILDSNLTTLITAVALYQFGTGPVRGFATTLGWGLVFSMFTAIIVTRAIFDSLTGGRRTATLSIGRLGLFKNTKFDFMRVWKTAVLGSAGLIAVGLLVMAARGGPRPGIDFQGGALLEVNFNPPVSVQEVRDALGRVPTATGEIVDLGKSEIKAFGTEGGIIVRVPGAGDEKAISMAVKNRLREVFPQSLQGPESNWLLQEIDVGSKISHDLVWQAIKAVLLSMIGILIYVGFRFDFKFGVGGIIALFHDVLITLGVFAILDQEISMGIVAALLTLVGFSINDTIVTYDRIRENRKLYRRDPFPAIVNRSINETLSRTIITSSTVFLVLLTLLFLGGEVNRGFALALAIGVIFGSYSSVYIASPVVVAWEEREEAREREELLSKGRGKVTKVKPVVVTKKVG
jgi:SecD/SecF fusion protein